MKRVESERLRRPSAATGAQLGPIPREDTPHKRYVMYNSRLLGLPDGIGKEGRRRPFRVVRLCAVR